MFNKALPRAVARAQRSFHTTSSVARVVATNPVKAQEVKVLRLTRSVLLLPSCSDPSDFQSWSSGKYPLIEHEYDAVVV